jgi:hypothetical protein
MEMTGLWKLWKAKKQVSHKSHNPLEKLKNSFPTFPQNFQLPIIEMLKTKKRVFNIPTISSCFLFKVKKILKKNKKNVSTFNQDLTALPRFLKTLELKRLRN